MVRFDRELLKLQVVLVWSHSSFKIWMDITLLSKNGQDAAQGTFCKLSGSSYKSTLGFL